MAVREFVDKAIATLACDLASQIERTRAYGKQLEALEQATGVEFVRSQWGIRYQSSLEIARSQLPLIRKAVGRLEIAGKDTASDFDSTREILVTVKPKSGEFNSLRFVYRTKFRAGGKCQVIEQQCPASTYKTLVCKA